MWKDHERAIGFKDGLVIGVSRVIREEKIINRVGQLSIGLNRVEDHSITSLVHWKIRIGSEGVEFKWGWLLLVGSDLLKLSWETVGCMRYKVQGSLRKGTYESQTGWVPRIGQGWHRWDWNGGGN